MNVRERLAQHPFARELSEVQLDRLAACATVARFEQGAAIFFEGHPATTLYLIVNGRVTLEQHIPARGSLQVENLVGGDLLGLSWLFPAGRWILEARAVEPTEAIVLDAACVQACMAEDPALGLALAMQVIHQLYERLQRVRLQRLDVYGGDL